MSPRALFVGITLIAFFSLAFAYFTQYALGLVPCPLCLYQRVPYFALIIAGLLGIITGKYRIILITILPILAASLLLAGYHTGVEREIFEAGGLCKGAVIIPENLSVQEATKLLYDSPVAACTIPAFKFLWLSMAEWNLLLSLFLLAISFVYLKLLA